MTVLATSGRLPLYRLHDQKFTRIYSSHGFGSGASENFMDSFDRASGHILYLSRGRSGPCSNIAAEMRKTARVLTASSQLAFNYRPCPWQSARVHSASVAMQVAAGGDDALSMDESW